MTAKIIGLLAWVAVLTTPVLAENCNQGLSYCGTGLIDRGYHQQRLVDALETVGQAGYSGIIRDSVFHCDNTSGDISFVTTCDVCKDGGIGKDDTCDTSKRDNCDSKYNYCGSGLLERTGYSWQIEAALRAAGQPTTDGFINKSLFKCKADGSGSLDYLTYCGNCVNAGAGNSDYCARDSSENCKTGIAYCGFNLMNRGGGYYDRLSNQLKGVFSNTADRDRNIGKTLFQCKGNGDVTALSTCNCLDGGAGRSDYCASPSCRKGLYYCGKMLMKNRRVRRSVIVQALQDANQPTNNQHVENSIYSYEPVAQDNNIKFISFCDSDATKCIDDGSDSDHCDTNNCRVGIDYCGSSLIKRDPSYSSIIGSGQLKSLYRCNGGADGAVEFIRDCALEGSCIDGDKFSDYCKN